MAGGEDGGSLLEFTHHITTANRNPRGISDIFITAVEIRPTRLGAAGNLGNLLAYWHEVIRLKTTAASSWPWKMS